MAGSFSKAVLARCVVEAIRDSIRLGMPRIRLACVRYLNTVPMIEGLEKDSGIELAPVVPSKISGLVSSGDCHAGLVSMIDAVRSPVPLAIIPVGMIGCDGPTLTVRLFSRVPLDRVTRIHADTDSHTSVVLCRLLIARLTGSLPEVVAFDARERVSIPSAAGDGSEWPDSLLMIGDKVVTDSPPAVRYPHQLDLGEAWKAWTGLPFMYAAWMCREADAAQPWVQRVATILDRQLRHNLTRLDWIIANRAAAFRWPPDLARKYLVDLLRFTVDDRALQGASRFLDEAAAAGLVVSRAVRCFRPI